MSLLQHHCKKSDEIWIKKNIQVLMMTMKIQIWWQTMQWITYMWHFMQLITYMYQPIQWITYMWQFMQWITYMWQFMQWITYMWQFMQWITYMYISNNFTLKFLTNQWKSVNIKNTGINKCFQFFFLTVIRH